MKPKDVLCFLRVCLPALGPALFYILNRLHGLSAGGDYDLTKEFWLKTGFCVVMGIGLLYMSFVAKKVGKADGLAFGYYYNFIHESIKFIKRNGKILMTNGSQVNEIPSTIQNIRILIVIPDNLHSYYLVSEVVKSLLQDVEVAPPADVSSRGRKWKWFSFGTADGTQNVLVDIPPTTTKTLRYFREHAGDVDHYLHQIRVDTIGDRIKFARVRKRLKGDISLFADSLESILKRETDLAPNSEREYDRIVTIKYATEFIHDVIDKKMLAELDKFSFNEDKLYKDAMADVDRIVKASKAKILKKMEAAIEGTLAPRKRSFFGRVSVLFKRLIQGVIDFIYR